MALRKTRHRRDRPPQEQSGVDKSQLQTSCQSLARCGRRGTVQVPQVDQQNKSRGLQRCHNRLNRILALSLERKVLASQAYLCILRGSRSSRALRVRGLCWDLTCRLVAACYFELRTPENAAGLIARSPSSTSEQLEAFSSIHKEV